MKRLGIWIAVLLVAGFTRPVWAQMTFRGFILNQDMFRTSESLDAMLIRNRLRLNAEVFSENVAAFASLDITNDITDTATTIPNLRDAYIDIYSKWLDLRIGKQQVVWGKTDGYFINDIVNPLDLSYFLLQDFDDIRMATTMLNTKLHYGYHSLEILVIPEFKPINLKFEGNWGYQRPTVMTIPIPYQGQVINRDIPLHYAEDNPPRISLKKAEYALKLNTLFLGTDLSLMYLKIREDRPVYFTQIFTDTAGMPLNVNLTPTHPWQNFYGLNFSRPVGIFVFRGEGGYYPERHFNTENQLFIAKGMIIRKPFMQFMLGTDYQLLSTIDLSVQAINERILDYDDGIQANENVTIGTLMLRGHFINETVLPLFLMLYNFEDKSVLMRASVDWNYADNFTIIIGADFLSGKSDTIFGMYDDNDNIFLKVKYSF